MERRILGKTGVEVAALGFGCGAVGGLMVRGTAADQERAVARALALGINYFDTAPIYGNGESEKNLGRVLKTLRPSVVVGTKVRIPDEARGRAAQAVTASLEASLGRLGLERVDLLQLHNLVDVIEWEFALREDGALEAAVEARQPGERVARRLGANRRPLPSLERPGRGGNVRDRDQPGQPSRAVRQHAAVAGADHGDRIPAHVVMLAGWRQRDVEGDLRGPLGEPDHPLPAG